MDETRADGDDDDEGGNSEDEDGEYEDGAGRAGDTYMTSYLPQAYRLSIIIDKSTLLSIVG